MQPEFSKILDVARRAGTPVIVTDPEGKAPIAIVPFETYAAMVEGKPASVPVATSIVPPVTVQENPKKPVGFPQGGEEQFYLEPVE